MDWISAWIQTKLETSSGAAEVRISMSGAPGLEDLLEAGDARWALELRCPSTQLARIVESSSAEFRAEWDASEIDGDLFLIPGLVVAKSSALKPQGLDPLWGTTPISIPAGTWLARGNVRRAQSLSQSLLSMNLDEDLKPGRMHVTPLLADGNLRFRVDLATDLHARRTHRDVQVAALIAGFGHIPRIVGDRDEEEGEFVALRELKERLRAAGVRVWGEEQYDPALAATTIEEFRQAHCPEVDS